MTRQPAEKSGKASQPARGLESSPEHQNVAAIFDFPSVASIESTNSRSTVAKNGGMTV